MAGQEIFANDRNKELSDHFLPGDPIGFLPPNQSNDISYLVDLSDGATANGLTSAQTELAIDRSMGTWDRAANCSDFSIRKLADPGTDPDLVDNIFLGPAPDPTWQPSAHITHGGWLPAQFFDLIALPIPDGSEFILAVTFTLVFELDANGNPVDSNGDGKGDAAIREIYYNDNFDWGINAQTDPYDVETVSLHEVGHGLSQGHFGKIFQTLSNGKFHFSPFAVMNAAISRQAQDLTGSDRSGHCNIWNKWPRQ